MVSSSCEKPRSTFIPAVAIPVSLIGTSAYVPIWLQSRQLVADALTISTGFVVDDAIVVIENGPPSRAGSASAASRADWCEEIGFTVVSISIRWSQYSSRFF